MACRDRCSTCSSAPSRAATPARKSAPSISAVRISRCGSRGPLSEPAPRSAPRRYARRQQRRATTRAGGRSSGRWAASRTPARWSVSYPCCVPSTCSDDTMTRDEQAEAVARAEASRRTRCAGRSRERGQLPIGDHLATRNRSKCLRATGEERAFVLEVDGNIVERDVLAGEIRLDPLDELQATTCYLVGPGRVRELVPDHAALGDDELPDAPALRLVRHLIHGHSRNPRIVP